MHSFVNQKGTLLLLLVYAVGSIYLLATQDGVGPEADSITHFLIAKYAPEYPWLFLDHWGKPLFTLLAAPFAAFGFVGIKTFNMLLTGINVYLINQLCKRLHLDYPQLAALFYLLFPLTLSTSFSGLTEPLFACFVLIHLTLLQKKHYGQAALLLSFVPFIRSEGLILLGIYGLVELYNKRYKTMGLLIVGHATFTLAGAFYGKNLLWVFKQIPYAHASSPYGSGPWTHFFDKMTYVMGIPLMVLFWCGLTFILYRIVKKRTKLSIVPLMILVYFLVFFIGHSIFWTFGIFNSMGLKRVFAAVTPLMAIIALYGFQLLGRVHKKTFRSALRFFVLVYILIFPFTSNPAANEFDASVSLQPKQKAAEKLALPKNYKRLVFGDPYLYLKFGIDPYNTKVHLHLYIKNLSYIQSGDLLILDDWYAPWDEGIEFLEEKGLDQNFELVLLQELPPYYRVYGVNKQ